MLIVAAVALAVLSVPLTGGRWTALADQRPRRLWTLWSWAAAQSLVDLGGAAAVSGVGDRAAAATLALPYLLAAVFVVTNRRLPGIWLVGLGLTVGGAAVRLGWSPGPWGSWLRPDDLLVAAGVFWVVHAIGRRRPPLDGGPESNRDHTTRRTRVVPPTAAGRPAGVHRVGREASHRRAQAAPRPVHRDRPGGRRVAGRAAG
jgi:hypothetical protein